MHKVELYERIRRDKACHNWSVRHLSKVHGCHRREIRKALSSPEAGARQGRQFARPAMDPWVEVIDAILAQDQDAPRKQRHTAHRIWVRLVTEHGAKVGEPTVRKYVRERKAELYGYVEAMVPQVHFAGQEAEADLYEADVDFDWGREVVNFFEIRACYSARSFHWPLRAATQQAFLEAHAMAFEAFEGVFSAVRYDNLPLAVRKILKGRERLQTETFTRLRSHYLFEAVFCQPGLKGAHEKGGIEGEGGYFRRNHLVPVPRVADWEALIELCRAGVTEDLDRHVDGRELSVGEMWEQERQLLRPLPYDAFDSRLRCSGRVDVKGRCTVLRNRYSVPVGLSGQPFDAEVGTQQVVLRHRGLEVARHGRLYGTGGDALTLDHYLEVLKWKPGALAGSLPLHQAKADGSFPPVYVDFFDQLRQRHGESEGARQMVDVLLLNRTYGPRAVLLGVGQALDAGAYDHAAVALLAREAESPSTPAGRIPRLYVLEGPNVPVPTVSEYDILIGG